MDVVVRVGGWEHACCGPAIERQELVDLGCVRVAGPDGEVLLVETHHDTGPPVGPAEQVERVRGRVADIRVVGDDGATRPVLRVPSGEALRGFDAHDDGHLEDPWTGEQVTPGGTFLVTVARTT
ncbi:MAG TPA: hypothetical protein VF661_17120 [Actinomycetales bacterium]|jgi:hypothetical protein